MGYFLCQMLKYKCFEKWLRTSCFGGSTMCRSAYKLHYSDNFTTAHQAAEKLSQAVHLGPAAISRWAAETHLCWNEMTMKWMKNASVDIFPHWGFLHPTAILDKNGKSKEQTNKPTNRTYHTCHSLFHNPPGFGPTLIPSYVLNPNALDFSSVGTDRGWSAVKWSLFVCNGGVHHRCYLISQPHFPSLFETTSTGRRR